MSGPPPLSINVKIAKTEVNTAQELREREKAAGRALQEEDTVTVQQNFSQSKEFIPENLVKTVSEGLASLDLKDGGTRSKKSVKVGPEDFEIRAVIGQGAYGRVLQVVQIKTKKIYAMKILQKGQVFKKKNVDYVKEERNILTKVDHPFVINLKCTFQTERKLYIVMEYAAGGELFNHLRNEGLFMEQTAAFYTAEIVLALEYLHYKGIIHRDLKPENVLLDETGHIRITDFGLAKVQEKDSTTAKTICGTDLYMAPEMLGGNGYGRAVDWWSLGTLLYEMLTGDPPFFARDTKKLYKKIMMKSLDFLAGCHRIVLRF